MSPINSSSNPTRNVLVTGANGYIGSAVCRAFVRAGWRTFGLIRNPKASQELILQEVEPVVGTYTDLQFLDTLFTRASTFDVIVSCTEKIPGYAAHFEEVILLVQKLAKKSNENGVRPLVLWSSGCKDYGTTSLHGDADLSPHTESSPLNGPELLEERTQNCPRVFEYSNLFDAAVIRPTNVFGYSSSYYGAMLDFAEAETKSGSKTLRIPGNANSILHATHVDDCAEAYLSLAEHADRSAVAGQFFNISAHRYETLAEVASALATEYGFTGGVEFVPASEALSSFPAGLHFVFSFSQWVGSEKIRKLTGWADKRMLFTGDLHVYRLAYDGFMEKGHGNIAEIRKRIGTGFKAEE
ncbi:hypothetical protein G7046_g823 [Stylonectria norvegica]|nr:hypothetical protein G7046_g823 [Stylonectria norvegica]